MNREVIDKSIEALETSEAANCDKLVAATLLVIGILQENEAYTNRKGQPVPSFQKAVNDVLMFTPFVDLLNHTKTVEVSSDIIVSRFINEEDRLYVEVTPFFNYTKGEIKDDSEMYLDKEEFRQYLNSDIEFETFFTPFKEFAGQMDDDEPRLLIVLLGFIWCASQNEVDEQVTRLLAYLIHSFEPVASKFDEDGVILAITPNGHIRRSSDLSSTELLMKSEFWEPKLNL